MYKCSLCGVADKYYIIYLFDDISYFSPLSHHLSFAFVMFLFTSAIKSSSCVNQIFSSKKTTRKPNWATRSCTNSICCYTKRFYGLPMRWRTFVDSLTVLLWCAAAATAVVTLAAVLVRVTRWRCCWRVILCNNFQLFLAYLYTNEYVSIHLIFFFTLAMRYLAVCGVQKQKQQ